MLQRKSRGLDWGIRSVKLEPVAAVGDPPTEDADGNGSQQRPQDGQAEIRYQSQRHEDAPEDFALHFTILARPTTRGR